MNDQDSIFQDLSPDETPADPVPRFFAIITDSLINLGLMLLLIRNLPPAVFNSVFLNSNWRIFVFVVLVLSCYRVAALFIFGKTIGMWLFRLKYLNSRLQPLSAGQKLLALFITQGHGIRLYKNK
ncbi:MAG: RDD family protein [Ferruginibacter sp.]